MTCDEPERKETLPGEKRGRLVALQIRVSNWNRATPSKVILLLLLVASVLQLWLVSGQHLLIIGYAGLDDRLYINLANNLLHGHGHYLGTYTNATLAKGPFYPIYIALANLAHIPLLVSEHMFYIIVCFVFLVSVWPLVNVFKKANQSNYVQYIIITLLGLLLIYNPMTSDHQPGTRVIREGIYPALTLLTISLFIALLSHRTARLWKYILISIGAGLSLSAFWLTKEEGIWIIPFVVGLAFYLAALIVWQRKKAPEWKKRIIVLAIPFVILWLSIYTVSLINYLDYGVRNTVEVKTPQFLAAYSSLTRVRSGTWMPVIPLPARNRQLIYKVSPAFSELKPYLEGVLGKNWATNSESVYPQYKGEIAGGWFMWAFRDAVANAGYYTSGKKAMSYYAKLASQVNAACDQGKLACVKSTDNMYPSLDGRYIKPFFSTFYHSFFYLISFKDYTPIPENITGDNSSFNLFSKITHQPATNHYGRRRVKLLTIIGDVYKYIFPVLTCLSLISYALLLLFKRSYKDALFIITGLIGATVVVRMVLLSFINVSSFPAINTLYFSSVYPLLIIFDVFSLVLLYKWFLTRPRELSGYALDMDVNENRTDQDSVCSPKDSSLFVRYDHLDYPAPLLPPSSAQVNIKPPSYLQENQGNYRF